MWDFFIPFSFFSVLAMILRDSNFLDIATSVLIHHDDMVLSGDQKVDLPFSKRITFGEVTWSRPTDGAFGAQ